MSIVFNSLPLDAPLRITSKYGSRLSPISNRKEFHYGVDLGRDRNKSGNCNILSVRAGTVINNYWNKSRGWVVLIKHDDNYSTLYQHLASASHLTTGSEVVAGQVIGIMGSTGDSTALHLHFELRKNGTPIDPTPFLQNIQEECDMTRQEVIDIVKEILYGYDTDNSAWYNQEFADVDMTNITDGTRPKGYATREEVAAMVARAMK